MSSIYKSLMNKTQNKNSYSDTQGRVDTNDAPKENVTHYLELLDFGSWTYDIKSKDIILSDEIYKLFECSPKNFENKLDSFLKFIHPEDKERISIARERIKVGKTGPDLVYKIITNSGNEKYILEKIKLILDDANEPCKLVGVIQDITKEKLMEKELNKLEYLAYHDELTGLPNSRYYKEELKRQWEYASETQSSFCLMMIETGCIRNINYALGFDVGDRLTLELVNRLKAFLEEDTFLSRYSDDHFAILIKGKRTTQEYNDLAKGLIHLFKKPIKIDDFQLDMVINIGISIYTDKDQSVDSLRKQAKVALVKAKKEGKNTYDFYSSDLDVQHFKEISLRNDLHKLTEENQLQVYYQPIVNLKTNKILAVEALARWDHPEWGIVSPDEFIPLAEDSGHIIEIGKAVLREVCSSFKEWNKNRTPNLKVSINLSSIQFFESDFVKNMEDIIYEHGLNPSFLIFEITDRVLLNNTDKVKDDIGKLKSLGIQLALDNFGVCYSSLSYLTLIDFDILKIDSSFIKNIYTNETCTVITKTIIEMAKELKVKLVAKGIENWEQLSSLKLFNCLAGQGHLYSRAIPAKNIKPILSNGVCKPTKPNDVVIPKVERRKFFRVPFTRLLEAEMTISEIKGRKVDVGRTKILIKNIGPGGLCFLSNISLPVERNLILQFKTNLLEEEIKVLGHPVWTKDYPNYNEYGVQFIVDENERAGLVKILNLVQIRMKQDSLFADGNFITSSPNVYFNEL
ncbi:MAG: EAL domain-containing protein [Tissierellaceae bacterium]